MAPLDAMTVPTVLSGRGRHRVWDARRRSWDSPSNCWPMRTACYGALRTDIEAAVPVGPAGNPEPDPRGSHLFGSHTPIGVLGELEKRARLQCGSLGGGNHFIEICRDENGNTWIMLHSGSRHVGKTLADVHINSAKDLMKRYFIDLPDPDLAYLVEKTGEFNAYIDALMWAQDYAFTNRQIMFQRVLACVRKYVGPIGAYELEVVNCHHNYTAQENHFGANVWVTRKGAVRAREGDKGIIPGSMGTCSYIVEGKGNPQSFNSCSHGAGRRMSRTVARRMFNMAEFTHQTRGVECRKDDRALLDEIPGAYKPIETDPNVSTSGRDTSTPRTPHHTPSAKGAEQYGTSLYRRRAPMGASTTNKQFPHPSA